MAPKTEPTNGSQTPPLKTCGVCKRPGDNLRTCSKCCSILYCSSECQKADWRIHKTLCKIFAETPCPNPTDNTLRRVIVFHHQKANPQIFWVRPDMEYKWAHSLILSVLGRPNVPRTAQDCLNPHHVPRQPPANHHTYIMVEPFKFERNIEMNLGVKTAVERAGLSMTGTTGFKGPVIITRREGRDHWAELHYADGPKVLNANMEDFTDAIKWFAAYEGLNCNPPKEEFLLRGFAWTRSSPEWFLSNTLGRLAVPGMNISAIRMITRLQLEKLWEEEQRTAAARRQQVNSD